MQELALEVQQTWNSRPLPIVQGTCCLDKNIALITLNSTTVYILDLVSRTSALWCNIVNHRAAYLYLPFGDILIPGSTRDLLLQLDVFHTAILIGNTLPIPVNLRCAGIKLRPIFVRLKGSLVGMSGNICPENLISHSLLVRPAAGRLTARATRVSVLKPCSSNIWVLVVDAQVEVGDSLNKSNASKDARNSSTNDDDPQWPCLIDRSFFDDDFGLM